MAKGWVYGLIVVLSAWLSSCTKTEIAGEVSKTELGQTISKANQLLTTTREGAATENYMRGSQAQFIIVITAAQSIYASTSSTQTQVTDANSALNASIITFQNQKVKQIDPDNLVAHWTFDLVSPPTVNDLIKDYTGHGHNAIMKRGPLLWGEGLISIGTDRYEDAYRALLFERGANLEIPYSPELNTPTVSISYWAKSKVNSPIVDNQYVVALNRGNCFAIKFQTTPKEVFVVNPAQSPGNLITDDNGTTISQGVWRHFVVTFGDGHMKFYVNGNLVKDAVHAGTVITQSPPVNLVIGQDLPTNLYSLVPGDPNYINNGGYFIGYLDEVRLYKSVLTAAQVTSIYQLEKP